MRRFFLILSSFLCLNLAAQERTSTKAINDDVLFAPEFHAYGHGRMNNAQSEGYRWYERFTIMHVSDIHSRYSQLQEALEVAAGKVDAVLNTGDDAHGCRKEDADMVKDILGNTSRVVSETTTVSYMQVPGNHDVTGLDKKEYFKKIAPVVEKCNQDVVWGDEKGFRSYGYVDFTEGDHEGDFRIIMLDPFDYDDGRFDDPYPFMSAVFSQKQVDWFIDALVDAAAKGLHVVTMMHYSFGDAEVFNEETANPDADFFQDPFMIPDIIDAVQNKAKLSKSYPDRSGLNDVVIDRDFSEAGDLDFVAHLFGHIHSKNDYQCQKSGGRKYDILMLGESAIGKPGVALNKIFIEKGTINDISFSALHIDVVEKAVYRVAYGAYLHYDGSESARTERIPYRF